jgi:hypothetical protein
MDQKDREFLRALHDEKMRTQTERANYVTQKLTFTTAIFGLSSINIGIKITEIYWLLYFIPMVSICYDLYIMSADSRIKRIGTFLGRHPGSVAGTGEKNWEKFCVCYRDSLAPSANIFFSIVVTLAAAVFIRTQNLAESGAMRIVFATWLVASISIIVALWIKHTRLIKMLGDFRPTSWDSSNDSK